MNELKTYSDIAKALWCEPDFSHPVCLETFSAVFVSPTISEETKMDRAIRGVFDRAVREGESENNRKNASKLSNPFYRLSIEERFILIALHIGNWSYRRISRLMSVDVDQVEEIAWVARIRLLQKVAPIGQTRFASCPEYNVRKPWTQKFLDDQIESAQERIFLQNHLMACDSCRETLSRCREYYYEVEKRIPRFETGDLETALNAVTRTKPIKVTVSGKSTSNLIVDFILRPDVFLISLFLIAFFWKLAHSVVPGWR